MLKGFEDAAGCYPLRPVAIQRTARDEAAKAR
jgi:hypothetical protein